MRRRCTVGLLLLLVLATTSTTAQQCREGAVTETPPGRFAALSDGSLLDRLHGLHWQRCSAGQHWTGEGCSGSPRRLSLGEARQRAPAGWRLPSLQELSSLAELACFAPAIDLRWFPDTPADAYWTATAFAGDPARVRFWQVNFIYGEVQPATAISPAFVRWVRGGLSVRGWRGNESPASAPWSDRD